jgi:hypothetical protein
MAPVVNKESTGVSKGASSIDVISTISKGLVLLISAIITSRRATIALT